MVSVKKFLLLTNFFTSTLKPYLFRLDRTRTIPKAKVPDKLNFRGFFREHTRKAPETLSRHNRVTSFHYSGSILKAFSNTITAHFFLNSSLS